MTMQHTAVNLILCTGVVLAVAALDFLIQRLARSRASAQRKSRAQNYTANTPERGR